jgi:hypothetical protein
MMFHRFQGFSEVMAGKMPPLVQAQAKPALSLTKGTSLSIRRNIASHLDG